MNRLLARIGRISSWNRPASPAAMSPPASGRRIRSWQRREQRAGAAEHRAEREQAGDPEQRRLLAEGQHGEQRRVERHEHAAQVDEAHHDRQQQRPGRRQRSPATTPPSSVGQGWPNRPRRADQQAGGEQQRGRASHSRASAASTMIGAVVEHRQRCRPRPVTDAGAAERQPGPDHVPPGSGLRVLGAACCDDLEGHGLRPASWRAPRRAGPAAGRSAP